MSFRSKILAVSLLSVVLAPSVQSFLTSSNRGNALRDIQTPFAINNGNNNDEVERIDSDSPATPEHWGRRSFVASAGLSFLGALVSNPSTAQAGIDVSGLRVDGQSPGSSGNLADQLKSYDGSGTARVQQIKASTTQVPLQEKISQARQQQDAALENSSAALYASRYRSVEPKLYRVGLGERFRCEDEVVAPANSKASRLFVSFEFPSDWLQLDRALGGIQYVDQRNGDKLYILKAKLPQGETLTTVNKKFFGDSIFDPNGTIVRSVGVGIDEYKVSSSTILNDGSLAAARRRLLVKFATVTGNGYRVERRGLVDAYEVDGFVYMLFTSSNAVKFDQKGRERETVEKIVDSFRLEKV